MVSHGRASISATPSVPPTPMRLRASAPLTPNRLGATGRQLERGAGRPLNEPAFFSLGDRQTSAVPRIGSERRRCKQAPTCVGNRPGTRKSPCPAAASSFVPIPAVTTLSNVSVQTLKRLPCRCPQVAPACQGGRANRVLA